ncbi:histone-lysine N-methyltransferase SETMAR [Trichonephila clavata]|uniref:Histone-lysine N-methyltransferase SETMAR n=1 Tax=Trichonephila clavata TaxID=2740835 RepID=A0A8X6J4L5_TRICU|nr:histone-lysine N-methyltransferase SETMAR [Trichonephila clavata]
MGTGSIRNRNSKPPRGSLWPGVMSKQMVRRWCRTFSDGRQQVEDIPRAGRTRTATTDANVGKVDDMIRANRRITIDEVAEELGISHERAQNIIHDILRYRKVSARWVPRQLTSTHQEQRMAVSLEHLVRYHEDGNDFLFRIVTGMKRCHTSVCDKRILSEAEVLKGNRFILCSTMLETKIYGFSSASK